MTFAAMCANKFRARDKAHQRTRNFPYMPRQRVDNVSSLAVVVRHVLYYVCTRISCTIVHVNVFFSVREHRR